MRSYRNTPAQENVFEPAEYWINVGIYIENPTTGEEQFLNLSRGIPLDNLEEEIVTRPDTEYGQMVLARNQMLKDLKAAGKQLEKGTSKKLPKLSVELRRKRDSVVETADISKNMFYRNILE